ncbi:MAG: WG repeat-containing protein [Bacteroidia bacterium]
MVIAPQYDRAYFFQSGKAIVRRDNEDYRIDRANQILERIEGKKGSELGRRGSDHGKKGSELGKTGSNPGNQAMNPTGTSARRSGSTKNAKTTTDRATTMKITSSNLLLAIALLLTALPLSAQPGTWAWMKGPQTGNGLGVYGTQGVPAPANNPPGFYESAHWTDQAGNFWVFGGLWNGFDLYGDLWRFEPATNMWTWMKGPQTTNVGGVYGTQGIPAPGNYPGTRSYGAHSWADNNGDLWLFGGYGYDGVGGFGLMNDLWKYDVSTNQWTWMKGSIAPGHCPCAAPWAFPASPTIRLPMGNPTAHGSMPATTSGFSEAPTSATFRGPGMAIQYRNQ